MTSSNFCPGLSTEEEGQLLAVAREIYPEWAQFTTELPHVDEREFSRAHTPSSWPPEKREGAIACLLLQLAYLDFDVTADIDALLREVARELYMTRATWPENDDYWAVLEAAIVTKLKAAPMSIMRKRHLGLLASNYFIQAGLWSASQ